MKQAPFNPDLFRKFAALDPFLSMMAQDKPEAYLEALFNSLVREDSAQMRAWNEFVKANS